MLWRATAVHSTARSLQFEKSASNPLQIIKLRNTRMTICCISGCKNVGSHRFPKDERLRNAWVDRILAQVVQHPNWAITSSSRLCSSHFQPDDFVHEGFHSGLKLQKRVLKPFAVPTVFASLTSLRASSRQRCLPRRKTRRCDLLDVQNKPDPVDWQTEILDDDANKTLSSESEVLAASLGRLSPQFLHIDAPILWCALQNSKRSYSGGIGPLTGSKAEVLTLDDPPSYRSGPNIGPTIVDFFHMPMSIFEKMDSESPEWVEESSQYKVEQGSLS